MYPKILWQKDKIFKPKDNITIYLLRWTDFTGKFAIEIASIYLQIATLINSPPFPLNNLAFSILLTTSRTVAKDSSSKRIFMLF